jgi:hypothetical protein
MPAREAFRCRLVTADLRSPSTGRFRRRRVPRLPLSLGVCPARVEGASNLVYRRPLRIMITGDLTDHPGPPAHAARVDTSSTCLLHDSNLSRAGVSGHAGAVHRVLTASHSILVVVGLMVLS